MDVVIATLIFLAPVVVKPQPAKWLVIDLPRYGNIGTCDNPIEVPLTVDSLSAFGMWSGAGFGARAMRGAPGDSVKFPLPIRPGVYRFRYWAFTKNHSGCVDEYIVEIPNTRVWPPAITDVRVIEK